MTTSCGSLCVRVRHIYIEREREREREREKQNLWVGTKHDGSVANKGAEEGV